MAALVILRLQMLAGHDAQTLSKWGLKPDQKRHLLPLPALRSLTFEMLFCKRRSKRVQQTS